MKKKWYRSKFTKTVLVFAEHVFATLIIASMLCALSYPVFVEEMLDGRKAKEYENSLVFEESMKTYSEKAIAGMQMQNIFETKGEYNSDKIIDIEEYWETNTVSGKNVSGLSFRLQDLLEWEVDSAGFESENDQIIVCEREDGTYQYYKYAVFASMIEEGKFKLNGFLGTNEELLYYMEEMGDTGENFLQIQDEKGDTLFVNCWNYNGTYFLEQKKPVGADSLLEIVNNNEHWNGRLQDACDMIYQTVNIFRENEYYYWEFVNNAKEGDTNFTYLYVDKGAGRIYSNQQEFNNFKQITSYQAEIEKLGKYVIVEPLLQGFSSNIAGADAETWRDLVKYSGNSEADFLYMAGVDTSFPVQDNFYKEAELYESYATGIQTLFVLGISSVVLLLVGLVWLTMIAGKRSEDEEIHLNWFDRWKTEVAAVLTGGLCIIMGTMGIVLFADNVMNIYRGYQLVEYANLALVTLASTLLVVAAFAFFLIGYLSLVRRIKAKTMWKNSLMKKAIEIVQYALNHIHSIWKMILLFGMFVVVHWFAILFSYEGVFALIAFVAECVVAAYLVVYVIGKEKIKKGIQMIAEGDVDYKISTEKMLPDHKHLAEVVNAIGEGLDAAVEKSMRSERLKTDLITNVSHDIKTPLTSIINYVDLLKKENFEDPKVVRYIEILEQKAQRLKVLTEDVVEASKVSSGNISLEYMRINFVEMIQQTSGEFEEKFKKRGLQEILRLPEEDVIIRVDGRRTWRILENIYSNAAKYAMEGSRVYADLKVVDKKAIFMLKNISEQPLNISADELTERFIRGDISRSTEGSGLGLSIARSLTEMQGGRFELYLDGDLFKVTIEFQIV